jgi:hypothetical protein
MRRLRWPRRARRLRRGGHEAVLLAKSIAKSGALAGALAGCSFALTRPPPSESALEHGPPTCTHSPGLAVADATLAATAIQLGAWWLLSWESNLLPAPPPEILIPVFALGAAHAAGAVYGYNQSLRCKEARWHYELSLAATDAPPAIPAERDGE